MDELKRKKPGRALVVLGNLVPLAMVLWFGADIALLFALFWAENVMIGAANFGRMLLNRGWAFPLFGRYGLAAFFLVHFGMFCAGHATLLRALFMPGRDADFNELNLIAQMRDFDAAFPDFGKAVMMMAVVQLMQFLTGLKKDPDFLTKPGIVQMFEPYPRIVLLQAVLVIGGALVLVLGQPQWALVLLVALKTVMGLGLWKYAPADELFQRISDGAEKLRARSEGSPPSGGGS